MKFSVVAQFSGVLKSPGNETSLRDAVRTCKAIKAFNFHGLKDLSSIGDSEYFYLAKEHGCETKHDSLGRIRIKCNEVSPYWCRIQDFQVSGILTRKEFETFVSELGLTADSTETLGTLGGPMAPWGGIVPDISMNVGSQELIDSIRVTPLPERHGEPCNGFLAHVEDIQVLEVRNRLLQQTGDRYWRNLRQAFLNRYQ